MARHIYTVEGFEERLSELTIGTEDVQRLMEFVRHQENFIQKLQVKVELAERLIGEYELHTRLMESEFHV
jgi:hypothetical protein